MSDRMPVMGGIEAIEIIREWELSYGADRRCIIIGFAASAGAHELMLRAGAVCIRQRLQLSANDSLE